MATTRPASVRHLQVFCAAARNSSFKQAARQLHLSPSAVSHRMRELEADLGIGLFERRTRAVELTPAGRTLFNEIAPLLDAVEQSLGNVAQRLQKQRLRVTAPQFFASESLIPKLSGFGVRWPQVDLQLDSTEPRPTAHPADADASILISAQRPDGVRAVALFELRLAAMCSPKYRSAIGPLDGKLPPDTVLLAHRSWPDGWVRWAEATGTELARNAPRVEYDSAFSMLRAAEHGPGLVLVPVHLGAAWSQGGALMRLDAHDVAIGDSYWFAARESDLLRTEVRAFRDWVLMEFSGA